ncbi:CTD nuclear envelope phosphatase 1 [Galdieria sulphuraria]|nr:CTD nuclear envelope phosphatase 1 [Galdieria sulphuraria]
MNSYKQRQSKTESVGAHISVAPAERTSTDKIPCVSQLIDFCFCTGGEGKAERIRTSPQQARDTFTLHFISSNSFFIDFDSFCFLITICEQIFYHGRKTLVLDLDETLVHSTTRQNSHFDIRLEVSVDNCPSIFYVNKRPYLDVFLRVVSQWYDLVVYTASLQKYADPLIDALDVHGVIRERYFRDHCIQVGNNFIKDISIIEPDLRKIVIVDNSPSAYVLHEENAIPIGTWPYVRPFAPFNLKLLNRSFIHFFLLETIVNNFTWLCSDKNVAMISKFIFFGWSVKCMNNSLGVISKPTTSDWPS